MRLIASDIITRTKAAEGSRTAMSFVKYVGGVSDFFIKSFFSGFLSVGSGNGNVFLAAQLPKRLLFLLSVHGPEGTAPVDTYGHSQETDAPNLHVGPLPAPVRLRARAVSNSSVLTSSLLVFVRAHLGLAGLRLASRP